MVRPDKVEGILENLRGYVEKLKHLASLIREEFLSDFTRGERWISLPIGKPKIKAGSAIWEVLTC